MENIVSLVPDHEVIEKIYWIRDKKVMLDADLAQLFGVSTKVFNQAVNRNLRRFPSDFMFELTAQEFLNLRSQIVTSSWGGSRYLPKVFTEQGVAMLSGVLKSDLAIDVNIQIIRVFTRMREFLSDQLELKKAVEELLSQTKDHSEKIEAIFGVLQKLLDERQAKRNPPGYKRSGE